jgi:hypothetical protein
MTCGLTGCDVRASYVKQHKASRCARARPLCAHLSSHCNTQPAAVHRRLLRLLLTTATLCHTTRVMTRCQACTRREWCARLATSRHATCIASHPAVLVSARVMRSEMMLTLCAVPTSQSFATLIGHVLSNNTNKDVRCLCCTAVHCVLRCWKSALSRCRKYWCSLTLRYVSGCRCTRVCVTNKCAVCQQHVSRAVCDTCGFTVC